MKDATAAAAIELSVERQLELAEEHAKSSQSTSDRLSQIVAEYRKIQESSAQEIEKKRSAVRSKCQERLWMAGVWRDYQLDIIKRSFDAEVKQIEREYQVQRMDIQECFYLILYYYYSCLSVGRMNLIPSRIV